MKRWPAIALILIIAAAFGLIAIAVQWNTAPTSDEPLHLVAAYTIRHTGDYRLNPEDPCLWERWVSLALNESDLQPDYQSAGFAEVLDDTMSHWGFVVSSLFHQTTPGNWTPVEPVMRKGRAMMAVIAVALLLVISAWAWRMGGWVAGVVAALLVATDPNLLGHAALIKNDLAMTLCYVAAAWATWRLTQRVTPARVLLLGAVAGVGLMVKYSGVLLLPSVALALAGGCLARSSQPAARQLRQIGIALAALVTITAIGVGIIWSSHGFRFYAVPGANSPTLNIEKDIHRAKINTAYILNPESKYAEIADTLPDPAMFRLVRWGLDHRALPEVWLKGLGYTYFSSVLRASYFLGTEYKTGNPWYFWAAALFKTPLGTITLGAVAAVIAWRLRLWRSRAFFVIACFAGLYGVMAMRGSLNLGLRHVFPIYGLAYVGMAVSLARGLAAAAPFARRALIAASCLCAIATVAETAAAYPNYIGFFNLPAQAAGPLNLLSDSNIDWGQDLPLLAAWQKAHPSVPLYLGYFGTAPPDYYGINYHPIAGTMTALRPKSRGGPGVWAISAPLLQGLYTPDLARPAYDQLRKRKPLIVLGSGLYLYEVSGVKAQEEPTTQP